MKPSRGIPRAPFFVLKGNGQAGINLNGGKIPEKKWIISCQKALADLAKMSQGEVEKYNTEVQRMHNEGLLRMNTASRTRQLIPGRVYILKSAGLVKIGRTANLKSRIKTYRTENPHGAKVLYAQVVSDSVGAEKEILALAAPKKVRGEWHKLTNREIGVLVEHLVQIP